MTIQLTAYDTSTTSETPLAPLGSIGMDIYGREWVYGTANGDTAAGKLCEMSTDGTYDFAAVNTAGAGTPGTNWVYAGAPDVAVTDNYYAWFWVGPGTFELIVENSFSAADVVYTTDTVGIVGADNSSFQIEGLKTIDDGDGSSRVTVWAAKRLTIGVVEAHD